MNNLMLLLASLLIGMISLAGCERTPISTLCGEFDCSGHGSCVLQLNADGQQVPSCVCDGGYVRSGSQGWFCLPDSSDGLCAGVSCSGHGSCVSRKGKATCACDSGYQPGSGGLSCVDPCAQISCSGQGTCKVNSSGPRCACNTGYRASADGKSCVAPSTGTFYTYKFFYNSYPTWQQGRAYLDVTNRATGTLVEHLDFAIRFDYGGRGLGRKARQVWTLDSTRKQVVSAVLDDSYIQAKITRRRRASASFSKGKATVTLQRLDKQGTHEVSYQGSKTPLPMLGGFEYPGWTLGCFSPGFYLLALERYDAKAGGRQQLEVYLPSAGVVQSITVQADLSWTAAKPVLLLPEYAVRVTYEGGVPHTIELLGQDMTWQRYSGVPADLNLTDAKQATTVKATALPAAMQEGKLSFSSTDGTPLAGTLALPKQGTAPHAAVLMVTDLDALDRDVPFRELPRAPLYQHLADHLAAAGFASLRYDPRTRGTSSGSTGRVRLERLAQDAEAAFKQLAAHKSVDPGKIYLLSLGRSSVVAVSLLARGVAIKGYLGLAPLLSEIPSAVVHGATSQLAAAGFSDNFLANQGSSMQLTMGEILGGGYARESWESLPVSVWKDYLVFNGAELLATYTGPVLLMRGDQDLETPASQLTTAAAAAKAAGKTNLTTSTLTGRTFIFTAGKISTLWEEAFLPFEVPSDVRSEILDWLKKN